MNCKEVKHLIIDYQDNSLDHLNKVIVEEHLKSCTSCMKIHKEFKQIIDTINQVQEELPDNDLQLSFNDMLAKEKLAQKTSKSIMLKPKYKVLKSILQVAASILLMMSCYLLGSYNGYTSKAKEITILKQEKTEMQTIATLSLIENESASKRLQAVSYAKDFTKPDNNILSVLITKMNYDKHTNVRLADIEEVQVIPAMEKLLQSKEIPSYIKDQIHLELKQII